MRDVKKTRKAEDTEKSLVEEKSSAKLLFWQKTNFLKSWIE